MGDSPVDNDLKPEYRVDGSCWKFVPVISEGIFNQRPDDIFRHHLILLQLQLAVIFTLAAIFHLFLGRFFMPRLISEVLVLTSDLMRHFHLFYIYKMLYIVLFCEYDRQGYFLDRLFLGGYFRTYRQFYSPNNR